MDSLIATGTCKNHPDRQASFRCTSCRLFFCSECASRHGNRLICTSCLQREEVLQPRETKPRHIARLFRWIPAVLSLFVLWMSFYFAGRILVEIPTDVHDGEIWEDLFE